MSGDESTRVPSTPPPRAAVERTDDVVTDALQATALLVQERVAAEAHDEAVGALRLRCAELEARIEALEVAVRLRDSIIEDQRDAVRSASGAEDKAREEFAANRKELAATQEELAASQEELAASREAESESRKAVEALQATVSWRLTRPLRWARGLGPRLKSRMVEPG